MREYQNRRLGEELFWGPQPASRPHGGFLHWLYQKTQHGRWQVVRRAERLGASLHPLTAAGLARVVRVMNSYYSHLIEGHGTTPADLEAVLRGHGEGTSERRDLQQLHFAHLATQEAMAAALAAKPPCAIAAPDFLQDLHRRFYEALPVSARVVKGADGSDHEVAPGNWRAFEVSVGRHLAPAHAAVPALMARFAQVYEPEVRDTGRGLVACAAAHRPRGHSPAARRGLPGKPEREGATAAGMAAGGTDGVAAGAVWVKPAARGAAQSVGWSFVNGIMHLAKAMPEPGRAILAFAIDAACAFGPFSVRWNRRPAKRSSSVIR